jgi:nitrate/nitrite transport system permease protein
MPSKLTLKAALISLLIFAVFIGAWHLATQPKESTSLAGADAEYAALMGKGADKAGGFPPPIAVGRAFVEYLSDPFYDKGPNDKGIGIQMAHSLARVAGLPAGGAGGAAAGLRDRHVAAAVQGARPLHPGAEADLAAGLDAAGAVHLKDSSASGIFVIFICSIWPMLINTAFGVATVRRDWLNVARTLEVNPLRKAFLVILPAAAPTILTGMRISMGIAWLVIVAAEMLVGGTGIGYFVWNEWNNLALPNVIFAVLMIGIVGMALDLLLRLAAEAGHLSGE